jgi:hypothetical protein
VILENRTFNEAVRGGRLNPFDQPAIVLCSYQFARTKDAYVRLATWDLVVIDEAHRLRNVYKTSSKIALTIKNLADLAALENGDGVRPLVHPRRGHRVAGRAGRVRGAADGRLGPRGGGAAAAGLKPATTRPGSFESARDAYSSAMVSRC